MNEVRKELEKQFKAFGLFELEDKPAETKSETEETVAPVVILEAPADFEPEFASAFGELPQKWQEYLIQREKKLSSERKKVKEGSELLNWLHGFDRLVQERGSKGFQNLKEWLDGLVWIDEKMHKNPAETLNAIAQVFGVSSKFGGTSSDNVSEKILTRLMNLDASFHNLESYLQQKQNDDFIKQIQAFGGQKDEKGELLHPYFDLVYQSMKSLLQNGLVASLEDAYKQAIWLNADIRKELIAQKINSEAEEAQKAQKAAFSPKGKAKAPERPLTLREEIEKNMAAFMD